MNINGSKRILVVDDDRSFRSLLSLVIEEEGYEVIEAHNGEDCLLQFSRNPPDLVLLDAVMPDMDGFSCCEELRSLKIAPEVPILMITFLDDRESIEKAFVVGATDYLTKPIHWAVLLQRLKRLIASSEAIQQLNDLKKWQAILNIFLESLSVSSLAQDRLTELFSLISEYFCADRILYIPSSQESITRANIIKKFVQFLEVNIPNSFAVINSPKNLETYPPEMGSILSSLEAKACLLSSLNPLPAHLIITSNNSREWQEIEIEKFKQITTFLSFISLI